MRLESGTHASLIERLQEGPSGSAWDDFVDRYGRKVFLWCRQWGMQQADAEDVTQEVLLAVARQIAQFRYDPDRSFRAWLKTVARRACNKLLEKLKQPDAPQESCVMALLANVEARDDLLNRIDEECNRDLMAYAMKRVQSRVLPHTWEAFWLLAVDGIAGLQVAERLKMPLAHVYVAKSNVQKMLREEIQALEKDDA